MTGLKFFSINVNPQNVLFYQNFMVFTCKWDTKMLFVTFRPQLKIFHIINVCTLDNLANLRLKIPF